MKEITTNPSPTRSIVRRYYAVSSCYWFGPSFIFAVYPLFLRSRGLNQFQVNTVATVFFFVWVLTDVPTGAFADAIGRRAAVVLGCAFHVAGFLVYYFSYHYWHFILAEVLDALGVTLGNGPIDAWMVDTLNAKEFEGPKDGIFSREIQLTKFTGMLGALAGAYVARREIALPFLLSAIAWAIAGMVALFLMHDAHLHRARRQHRIMKEVRERMIDSMRIGFGDRAVMLMSLAMLASSAAWMPWWQEWPRYFTELFGARIEVMGWLFVGYSIAQMFGAELVNRIETAWTRRSAWLIGSAGMVGLTAMAVAVIPGQLWLSAVLFFLCNAGSGASLPVLSSWYNEQIEGENRATLLSFQSTFSTLGGVIGLPVGGLIMDHRGASAAWVLMGVFSLLQAPCFALVAKKSEVPGIAQT